MDSLPWDGVEDVKLKDAWRPTIMRIADRAGVADDDAAKAVQLSRSRGLDLGTSAEDAERLHAMVPFLDLFNHPSLGALEASGARERVGKASVFDSCVKWYLSDDRTRVLVDAPSAFATPASQAWLWYGYDAKDHGAFVEARTASALRLTMFLSCVVRLAALGGSATEPVRLRCQALVGVIPPGPRPELS